MDGEDLELFTRGNRIGSDEHRQVLSTVGVATHRATMFMQSTTTAVQAPHPQG